MARSGNPKTENKLSVFFFSVRFHSAYVFLVQYMHTHVNTIKRCLPVFQCSGIKAFGKTISIFKFQFNWKHETESKNSS